MRNLTEKELLGLWEDCFDRPLIETSLRLIHAASISDGIDVSALSIGQRDIRLLQLREWMFGSRFKNVAACPHCSEHIEWENEAKDLRLQALTTEVNKIYNIEIEGFNIQFRLPASKDLLNLTNHSGENMVNELLTQCVLQVQKDNVEQAVNELPENVIEKLNEHMSQQDPQADIMMLMTCPSCSGQWESVFDIVSYLWAEVNAWARHMLQDICILAKFFGWSEKDILEISPKRRQLYLQMVST